MGRNMKNLTKALTGIAIAGGLFTASAQAAEVAIGEPIEKNGMEIAAVYLQAVQMEPIHPSEGPSDIHLEADIHAIKGNNNGFGEGEWMPFMNVTYKLEKIGSDWSEVGLLLPMSASDGPHYGQNIKMDGAGKYRVTFNIASPAEQGFLRHTDKETGVGKWWAPFSTSWEFVYAGAGKKGGY